MDRRGRSLPQQRSPITNTPTQQKHLHHHKSSIPSPVAGLNYKMTSDFLPQSTTEEELMSRSEVSRNICPKILYIYDQKQHQEVSPHDRKPWVDKVLDCYNWGREKVLDTPCEKIREAYQQCLMKPSYTRHSDCYHFKDTLGKCVVKHVPSFQPETDTVI
ncbi:hypothetical protein ACA910_017240 [Epithemia clementina (nom. ined.)]